MRDLLATAKFLLAADLPALRLLLAPCTISECYAGMYEKFKYGKVPQERTFQQTKVLGTVAPVE